MLPVTSLLLAWLYPAKLIDQHALLNLFGDQKANQIYWLFPCFLLFEVFLKWRRKEKTKFCYIYICKICKSAFSICLYFHSFFLASLLASLQDNQYLHSFDSVSIPDVELAFFLPYSNGLPFAWFHFSLAFGSSFFKRALFRDVITYLFHSLSFGLVASGSPLPPNPEFPQPELRSLLSTLNCHKGRAFQRKLQCMWPEL